MIRYFPVLSLGNCDRLDDAVGPNRLRKLLQLFLIKAVPRLFLVRLDLFERNVLEALFRVGSAFDPPAPIGPEVVEVQEVSAAGAPRVLYPALSADCGLARCSWAMISFASSR